MAPSIEKQSEQSYTSVLADALGILLEGLETLLGELRKSPETVRTRAFADLEGSQGFLQTLQLVSDTMPLERFRDAIKNVSKSVQKSFTNLPRATISKLSATRVEEFSGRLDFLCRVTRLLGPDLRVARNEMAAWIRVDRDDVQASIFTVESVVESLKQRGVVFGLDEEKIREALSASTAGEEICVAKGKKPVQGRDGTIEYKVDAEDLSRTPKILESGRASFKDINLYTYVGAGDALAVKIPPTPGTPGSTVTGRPIHPLECSEAEFPECSNAKTSEDGNSLIATIDGAVSRQGRRLVLDPTLRVANDVAYETGNIDSKVTVMVGADVRSGFSVKTERDICIQSVVEGAKLEADGNITAKGGIEGGGKAVIDANGDVAAKYISNATITSLQNIVVESGIVQSKIWAGKRVIVTGHPGEIVGGEIDADEDVVANTIGSDMGVKTFIRLGKKTEQIAELMEENEGKCQEQEAAVEKCSQIIDVLRQQMAQQSTPSADLEKGMQQARQMMTDARQNIVNLTAEHDDLLTQYEEGLRKSRTVRARKNILPGTVITISGAELEIKEPTGPATVVKYGDELSVFPFRELTE